MQHQQYRENNPQYHKQWRHNNPQYDAQWAVVDRRKKKHEAMERANLVK